jgi:hypothetical protein
MRFLAAMAIAAGAWAQGLAPDQAELLATARRAAVEYSKSLPDFLCTQIVRRSEDVTGANRWIGVDALTIKVSYSGHEHYELLLRNGRHAEGDLKSVGGAISAGEFGTRLLDIFARESAAEFGWKGWGRVRKQRAAVFTYRVDREHSRNQVTYGDRLQNARTIIAAFHGEISVDPESGATLRVTLVAEMPPDFAITACSSWTEYDYRNVAGRRFLVPVASESKMERDHYRAVNEIEFRDYRKFQTEATIVFK